jgi:hypothetical protein
MTWPRVSIATGSPKGRECFRPGGVSYKDFASTELGPTARLPFVKEHWPALRSTNLPRSETIADPYANPPPYHHP